MSLIDEIEAMLEKITPLPWGYTMKLDVYDGSISYSVTSFNGDCDVARCGNDGKFSEHDAHLIAHAPEWLRMLVERVRKLESGIREIDTMREMFPDDPLIVGLCDKAIDLLDKEST